VLSGYIVAVRRSRDDASSDTEERISREMPAWEGVEA
jgi:hypothetical protein